jgi:hypothetical protein
MRRSKYFHVSIIIDVQSAHTLPGTLNNNTGPTHVLFKHKICHGLNMKLLYFGCAAVGHNLFKITTLTHKGKGTA